MPNRSTRTDQPWLPFVLVSGITIGVALLAIVTSAFPLSPPNRLSYSSSYTCPNNLAINSHTYTCTHTSAISTVSDDTAVTSTVKSIPFIFSSWLKDALKQLGLDLTREKQNMPPSNLPEEDAPPPKNAKGKVIRTAAKAYHAQNSIPSSAAYTTAKASQSQIVVTPQGVQDDYNHYRTVALDNTLDRAVSILTTDVMQLVKEQDGGVYAPIQVGDLGENIYVEGIPYTFFQVGQRYQFQTSNQENAGVEDDLSGVVVEITERIEPCGNLCKLPFINDESLPPLERVKKCQSFLLYLDQKDGLRGWYGKIIGNGGTIQIGDSVSLLAA